MERFIVPEKVDCRIGTVRSASSSFALAMFFVDYGVTHRSLLEMFERYKRLTLDVHSLREGQFTYVVTCDKMLVELNAETVRRATLQPNAKAMLRELATSGEPEFSVTYAVERDEHELFSQARDTLRGTWLLLVAAEDVSELLIDKTGIIVQRNSSSRKKYGL